MHCYDLMLLMLHLTLVFTVGDMLHDKLIRCHRTELIRATTFVCMGRPCLGLPVGSLMCITKEGRLCARSYPVPVSGDSLENQFVDMDPFPVRDKFCHDGGRFDHVMVGCHAMAVCLGHGATQDGMSVIRTTRKNAISCAP